MKIKPDRKCQYVEAGSTQCASLVRISRDPWLRIEWRAEQARLRAAWSEAQHIKSVKQLEREFECRHQARGRDLFWFRVKARNWGDDKGKGLRLGSSSRAIRIGNTRGWMPRYATPIRTAQGLLFPFQRTVYRNAKSSKQGAAKDLVLYGAEGAHEFDDGALAFFSSVGLSVEEAAQAFDGLERVNRSAAANAKVVHHMIIQSMHELPPEEQWAMLLRYCDQVFGSQDLPYSVCLHAPSEQGDQRNWHAHIVFSYRPMVHTDEAEWQIGRAIRTDLDCPEQWTRMRFLLSEELNRTAEMHGVDKRYTHLSYAAAGLDYIPQEHLGAGLTEKVRRGEKVELNEQNMAVAARNSALHAVREMRKVLCAGVAAVADFIRTERNAVLAATQLRPLKSARDTRAFDIRGVRIPVMPSTMEDSKFRVDVAAANDDIAALDRDEASAKLASGATVPEALEAAAGAPNEALNPAHFPTPILPEALVERYALSTTMIAETPDLPESLTEGMPHDTIWKAPPLAPSLPRTLSEDDEDESSAGWWITTRGPAATALPQPIDSADTEVFTKFQLAEAAPRLPVPLAVTAESPPARTLEIYSGAEHLPALPDELDLEEQVSSNASATLHLLFRKPLHPDALISRTDVSSLSSLDPVFSMPSEPVGVSPRQVLESHFSGLKLDRPSNPGDLLNSPNSDADGRSSPTDRSADGHGAARLENHGTNKRRRTQNGEPKSSQESQRLNGVSPWLFGGRGNDL